MEEAPGWRRRAKPDQSEPEPRQRDIWLLLAGSLAVAVLLAGGGYYGWQQWRSRAAATPAAAPKPAAATPQTPPSDLSFSGEVQARNIIPIGAPVEGTLELLEVQAGQEVFEEQLLGRVKNLSLEAGREAARLDAESAQDKVNQIESALIAARLEASRTAADADRTRSQLTAAERDAQRQRLLYNEGVAPRLAYERAQKALDSARQEAEAVTELARQAELRVKTTQRDLETARKTLEERLAGLEDTTLNMQAAELRSPVDGLVTRIAVEQGAEVGPHLMDLFQIAVNPGELYVPIEPTPEEQKRLTAGAAATVQILELSAFTVQGKVAITESGAYRVEFDTGDAAVKPGLAAVVKIKLP